MEKKIATKQNKTINKAEKKRKKSKTTIKKKTNKQTHNVGISERLVKITPTRVLFNYDST